MTSSLFTPIALRGLTLPNRIAIAPMCQYSAENGSATDWHMIHIGSLSLSGAGLFIIEATAVEPRGRITPHCLGLWSDENEAALARVMAAVRKYGNTPMAVQLGHAGRKASTHRPWEGRNSLQPDQGAWQTVAPSAVPWGEGWHMPEALDRAGMNAIKASFLASLARADRVGFDLVEVHSAHGYLFSQFLSPIANKRNDEYGGSLENRMRFPLECIAEMRAAWPADKPLGVRFSATDWEDKRGFTPDDAVVYARELKAIGIDYVDVSSGGNSPAPIPLGPGYQVPLAARVKAEADIVTMAVGMITEPQQAEDIVASGKADIVALARGMLYDPHWPWHAAEALGAEAAYPPQYARSEPSRWPQAWPNRRAAE